MVVTHPSVDTKCTKKLKKKYIITGIIDWQKGGRCGLQVLYTVLSASQKCQESFFLLVLALSRSTKRVISEKVYNFSAGKKER
jgi:hypothetical protein